MSTQPPPIYYGQEPPAKRSNAPWIILAVLGGGACLLIPIMAAILFPVFSTAKKAAMKTACLSNVKQLAIANLMYREDFDDRMPPAATWTSSTETYFKNPMVLKCPESKSAYGYAFNAEVGGKDAKKIKAPETIAMIFEMDSKDKNAVGDPNKDAAQPPRHGEYDVFGYVDGHARAIKSVP